MPTKQNLNIMQIEDYIEEGCNLSHLKAIEQKKIHSTHQKEFHKIPISTRKVPCLEARIIADKMIMCNNDSLINTAIERAFKITYISISLN